MLSISVVVPVYSGEKYLRELTQEIERVRDLWQSLGHPFGISELLFVEDGAIDGSGAVIDELAAAYPWITALHLSRNYGQHPATIAGILHTAGDWVVTMDEDLQHPPHCIEQLLRAVALTQADIAYGRSDQGVHKSAFRDLSSRLAKRSIEFLSGSSSITQASSFRLIRGSLARGAASVCGHDTYLDVALSWFTQRVETATMELVDRRFIATGKSGYSFKSLISHGRRLIFSSQVKVLRFAMLLGAAAFAIALIAAFLVFIQKLLWPSSIVIQGWASLFLAVTLIGGLTIFLLGVLLEYMSVLMLRAHGKPLFFLIDRSGDAALSKFFAVQKG